MVKEDMETIIVIVVVIPDNSQYYPLVPFSEDIVALYSIIVYTFENMYLCHHEP